MFNSLTARLHRPANTVQTPPLHSQDKAPKLNQDQSRCARVAVANSLSKAGSKFTGLFRARQREVSKHEQRDWHAPLMAIPPNDSAAGLQMVNSSAAHAITQKLNAEGKFKDIRALRASESGVGVQGFVMRDQDGHYHQLQQSAALISTLKSSMPIRPDKMAGTGHQAESSAIFTDHQGGQHTLHGRTLYHFDRTADRWTRTQPEQNDISRLSLDHRGQLITYRHKDNVRDHSATNTHLAQLYRDGKVHLAEQSDLDNGIDVSLRKADGQPIEVQRVGLLPPSNGRATLFAMDKDGELYHHRLPQQLTSNAPLTMQPVKLDFAQAVGNEAGKKAALEGFIADSGSLKAVLRDGMGLRHAATLELPRQTHAATATAKLSPGWRLSEQLHLLNQSGLPERIGADDTQVRLHGGAALGLNKTRDLCGWNETTQHWDKLHVHGVTQLLRGLDDKPYIIQDGQPKAVDASFAQPKLKMGNDEAVALGRSTAAEVGRVLSEDATQHCAVLDDKHFALLGIAAEGAPATLKASLDGLSVDIPAPRDSAGVPLAIDSVALDQSKHLYVAAGGNLFKLPHDQWTQTHQGPSAAWQPAGWQAGDGRDMLQDKIKEALQTLPNLGLTAGQLAQANVAIDQVAMGANKRPVFQATLCSPAAANAAPGQPGVVSHALELHYDRNGNAELRPVKALVNPKANSQWETMQARNHTTTKVGNANGSATTTLLGSTNDNVRTGSNKNIFKNAAEGFRKMNESYQHHFHPLEAPKAKTTEVIKAYRAQDTLKEKLQAAGHMAVTAKARSRAGLNPVYRESQRLYESFKNPTAVANKAPFDTRLAGLKQPEKAQTRDQQEQAQLHKGLKALRDEAEDSSYHAIVRLGQLHGLLDERGEPLRAPLADQAARGPVEVLANALSSSGLDATSKPRAKLDQLINLGLQLPERSLEPSLDNPGRNKSSSSLLEDRVLLDAQALHQMGDLLTRVYSHGLVTGAQAPPGKSTSLDQLQGLRQAYENSDIKLFSDNGVVSHRALEKLQQARDTVSRELTGKYGLKYNTSRSFGADLRAIGDHLGNLEVGDATALLRSKGATLTSPSLVIPLTPDGGGLYLNFGVGREHGFGLSSEGGESATTLGLKNSHSTNQFLNVGYYHAPSAVTHRLLGGDPNYSPSRTGQLYSADVSAKATQTHAIAGWLTASNASMANVMENLLDPSASLADLYRLGQEKTGTVAHSKVSQQTLGAGISVDLGRLSLGGSLLSDNERSTWNAFLRATAGISADTTLLNNSKSTVTTHKGEGQDAFAQARARDVLPAASVGAYARAGMYTGGYAHADSTPNNMGVSNHVLIGQSTVPDALSVSFAMDRAKNDEFKLNFKPGKAVTTPLLHDVEKALGKVLKDSVVAKALEERQALLGELDRCAPSTAPAPVTLRANPLGGFAAPSLPARARPVDTRLGELRDLLPRLRANLPKEAGQVQALADAVNQLPATATDADKEALLESAQTLGAVMRSYARGAGTEALREKATKAIEAGEPLEKDDLEAHLKALKGVADQLNHLPHDSDTLRELRYSIEQLSKHNELSKAGGRYLASAEHKYTSTGVQLSKGGLIGANAPWRERTSSQNANAIAAFINKHPVLQEMARRAEREGPTSMELTLELKPKVLEKLEASLNAQAPDLQEQLKAALSDDNNIRIKSITLLRGAAQTDSKATPNLLLSAKSSASVTDSVVLASMAFKYSQEQEHQPVSVTPGGLLVQARVDKPVRDDLEQHNIAMMGSRNRKDLHSASDEDVARDAPAKSSVEHATSAGGGSANTGSTPHGTGAL